MYTEQRRNPRVPKSLPLRIGKITVTTVDGSNPSGQCRTVDISPTGLCFRSSVLYAPSMHLLIRVELGQTGSFPVVVEHRGVVRWSRKDAAGDTWLIGVELSGTTPEEKQKWLKHLQFRSESIY
jgi:hypothetical protein